MTAATRAAAVVLALLIAAAPARRTGSGVSVHVLNATPWHLIIYQVGADRSLILGTVAPGAHACYHLRGHAGITRLVASPDAEIVVAETPSIDMAGIEGWRWRIDLAGSSSAGLWPLVRGCATHRV